MWSPTLHLNLLDATRYYELRIENEQFTANEIPAFNESSVIHFVVVSQLMIVHKLVEVEMQENW